MQRLFVLSHHIQGTQVTLSKQDRYHLEVVKTKVKDPIELIVVDTKTYITGNIQAFSKRYITLETIESKPLPPSTEPDITLIQCLAKPDRFGEILRACTEIGVNTFIPTISERVISNPEKKESNKLERWNSIIFSASSQSRRNELPFISPIVELGNISNSYDLALVFWEEETLTQAKSVIRPFFEQWTQSTPPKIGILIGPEGGLSPEEVEALKQKNFISVSLGSSILRVEHAGLVACGMINYESTR